MTALHEPRPTGVRWDFLAVAAVQAIGAGLRLAFHVALARSLTTQVFAEVAVALSWSQILAAAVAGGAGAYLLKELPELLADGRLGWALGLYGQTLQRAATFAALGSLLVIVGLRLSLEGLGWAAAVIVATSVIRALLVATQEALRSLGGLLLSQATTLILQPMLTTMGVAAAAVALGAPVGACVPAAALAVGLAVPWYVQHRVVRDRLTGATVDRDEDAKPLARPDLRALLASGASTAWLVWMVEGAVVLAAFTAGDAADVALLAAHVRVSVVTSVAAVVVSTVATTRWSGRIRNGGGRPDLREALRWSGAGAAVAAAAGGALLVVAGPILSLFGREFGLNPAILLGLVGKDVALAGAAPLFYLLVLRERTDLALRASTAGGLSLLGIVPASHFGGGTGAATAAFVAGIVWFLAYLLAARSDR
jgi:hypothetical protein